jgi:hypothetical protein
MGGSDGEMEGVAIRGVASPAGPCDGGGGRFPFPASTRRRVTRARGGGTGHSACARPTSARSQRRPRPPPSSRPRRARAARPARAALNWLSGRARAKEGAPARGAAAAAPRRALPSAARAPRYGLELGGTTCLVALMCLAFAVSCPLVPLLGAAFFAGEWLRARCAGAGGGGEGAGEGRRCHACVCIARERGARRQVSACARLCLHLCW